MGQVSGAVAMSVDSPGDWLSLIGVWLAVELNLDH